MTSVRVLARHLNPVALPGKNTSFLNRDIVKYGPKAFMTNVSAFRQELHLDPNDTNAGYLQSRIYCLYNSDAIVVQRSLFTSV